jgi:hypothetical protein
MKGAEFIGIFRPLNNKEINDPVRERYNSLSAGKRLRNLG